MKCPIDDNVLQMSERNGIEIDYCPQCRGVWLDRGELDKIIDRALDDAPGRGQPAPAVSREVGQEQYRPSYPPQQYDQRAYKKRRKESFLGELFDF